MRINRGTFEDGVAAGYCLLELISELDPHLREQCGEFVSNKELQEFYSKLWEHYPYPHRSQSVEGFLSIILKPRQLSGKLITLWGKDEFWKLQSNCAPICNAPRDASIYQLGDWTGESDGDGWCLDLTCNCIRCVYVGSGTDDLDQLRLGSYAVLPSFWQWVAYLRCSAWERGWLKKF
jgi:hypothetical protein